MTTLATVGVTFRALAAYASPKMFRILRPDLVRVLRIIILVVDDKPEKADDHRHVQVEPLDGAIVGVCPWHAGWRARHLPVRQVLVAEMPQVFQHKVSIATGLIAPDQRRSFSEVAPDALSISSASRELILPQLFEDRGFPILRDVVHRAIVDMAPLLHALVDEDIYNPGILERIRDPRQRDGILVAIPEPEQPQHRLPAKRLADHLERIRGV